MPSGRQGDLARWLPVAAAGGLLAIVVGVGVAGRGGGEAAGAPTSAAVSVMPAASSTSLATQPATTAAPGTVPVAKVPLTRTLGNGVTGDDVRMVQQRLTDLGFDLGAVDGVYGAQTIQAVWAYEKLVLDTPRNAASGRVTPEMWDALQEPDLRITPRRATGGLANHVEVYLPEQVMVIFHADRPVMVAHISSGELDAAGNPAYYCDKATWDTDANGNPYPEPRSGEACAYAKTPGGVFTIRRMVQGKRVSPLGGMMNPAYFNYGIAIHGADQVPLEPASHGCVRINQYLGAKFQDLIAVGDRVLVWGHDGKQPEQYTQDESLPSFDARTYDTTTTTSTTTTSTTTTTVVPSTTSEPVSATTTSTSSTSPSSVPTGAPPTAPDAVPSP